MRKKFHALLHAYKVEAFKISHNNECVQDRTRDILQFTEQALNNAYHYQFHGEPDQRRVETLTLIKNFTLEAILPPVVEKLVQRISVLERQHEAMVQLVDGLLEELSEDHKSSENAG
ncbi:MAG: hypothetical protein KDB80_06465 [Planctomycetes bacterium]|nr:hypothetical protein [Planctomycetota bacterium]